MVDSEPHSVASWVAVLALRGVTLDQATINRVLGKSLRETSQMLVEQYHLPDQAIDLGREKADYQIAHLDGNIEPMPGLVEVLNEVDQRGLKKAVASSSLRRYVIAVLKAVNVLERFSVIVAGDDVLHGKPAPDVFLAAANVLQIEPARCLVLEDSPAGVQAAKAGGMKCIAIPNMHSRTLDLSAADQTLPSLITVRDTLDRFLEDVMPIA